MKFMELSEENIEKLRAAQRAIVKLEFGGIIASGSSEHDALSWAVTSLTAEMLFDNRPLTDKDRKRAEEIGNAIVLESIHDSNDE